MGNCASITIQFRITRMKRLLLHWAISTLFLALSCPAQTTISIQFASTNYAVAENGGSATITIRRSGNIAGAVTVNFATADGTAKGGTDYLPVKTDLVFMAGELSKTVAVPVLDDGLVNGDRTVRMTLSSSSSNTVLGDLSQSVLNIQDNERPVGVDISFNLAAMRPLGISAMLVQHDDQILVGGWFQSRDGGEELRVMRLNSQGVPDPSFDTTGIDADNRIAGSSISGLAFQPDGKVLVASPNSLVRLNMNGSIDPSFQPATGARFVTVQPNGYLLTSGDSTLARLSPNGSLDSSFAPAFSGNGGDGPAALLGAVVQPDAKVIVWGYFDSIDGASHTNLARLQPNGRIDTAFNVSLGWLNGLGSIQSVLVLQDQRLVIAGEFDQVNGAPGSGIARLHPDGTLDETFKWPLGELAGPPPYIWTSAEQPDGHIVLVGGFPEPGSARGSAQLIRLNADGTRDPTFGSMQFSPNFLGEFGARVSALAVRSDSAILVAGTFLQINGESIPDLALLYGNPETLRTVQFSAPEFAAAENIGSALITVTRNGNSTEPLSVEFDTANGTAVAGVDYDNVRLTVTFAPLETEKRVEVPLIDNSRVDGNRTVRLTLHDPSSGVVLYHAAAILTIQDNETPLLVDSSFDPGLGFDGPIAGMALQTDGRIVIGGSFTHVAGLSRPYLARLNIDGSLDAGFSAKPNSNLRGVLVQPDGKFLLWGYGLTSVNGTNRDGIARLNPDGTLDANFRPRTDPGLLVDAVALQGDGKILIGGYGSLVLGSSRRAVARLNADGMVDTTFNAGSFSSDTWLHALLWQRDGKIVVAGQFEKTNGVTRRNLARLNADGSLDPSFEATPFDVPPFLTFLMLDQQNRIVAVDGESSNPGPIIRLQPNGLFDSSFDPGLRGSATGSLALAPDGSILFGGTLNLSDSLYQRVGRISSNGVLDPQFNVKFTTTNLLPADITSVLRQDDGKLLVAGAFHRVNGMARNGLVRLYTDGSGPPAFALTEDQVTISKTTGSASITVERLGDTSAAAEVGYSIGPAGPGSDPGFVPLSGILDFAPLETAKTVTWAVQDDHVPGLDKSLIVTLSDPTAGLQLGGGPAAELIRIADDERPGSVDLSFDPGELTHATVNPDNSGIQAIVVEPNGKILAGAVTLPPGVGTGCGGCAALVRFNADGTLDTSFSPESIPSPWAMALKLQPDGKILLSGYSPPMRFNSDGTPDPSFAPSGVPPVFSGPLLVQADGRVIVAGRSGNSPSSYSSRIVRMNSDGSIDPGFNALLVDVNGFGATDPSWIYAMLPVQDGKILVAGDFTRVNGLRRTRIARLNPDGSTDTNFTVSVSFQFDESTVIKAIALQPDQKILLGGLFSMVNGNPRPGLTRLHPDGSLDLNFVPGIVLESPPCFASDAVSAIALQSDGKVIVSGSFALSSNKQRKTIVRLNPEGSVDSSFEAGEVIQQLNDSALQGSVNVLALTPDGTGILAGGTFTHIDGVLRYGIAQLKVGPAVRIEAASASPEDGIRLSVRASGTRSVVLQGSSNLLNWVALSTNLLNGPMIELRDADLHHPNPRFYRVSSQ
jgi:uncharacterized delta-60 repeat protein